MRPLLLALLLLLLAAAGPAAAQAVPNLAVAADTFGYRAYHLGRRAEYIATQLQARHAPADSVVAALRTAVRGYRAAGEWFGVGAGYRRARR